MQTPSTSGGQTGPTLSLQETIGIQGIRQTSQAGFEDELELVLASTGCQVSVFYLIVYVLLETSNVSPFLILYVHIIME